MGSLVLKTFGFAIVLCVTAFLVFDASKYASLKDSSAAVFFRDSGAQQVFLKFRHYSKLAYRWSQKNVPLYVTRARENLIPILLLVGDMIVSLAQHVWTNLKLLYYYIIDKKPMAVKWMDHNVPGLTERMAAWLSLAREFMARLASLLLTWLKFITLWLRDYVFVGTPPECMEGFTKHSEHQSGYRRSSHVLEEREDDHGHF